MRVQACDVSESSFPVDHPVYRVNFWERPGPDYAWNLEAWYLREARDVHDVIRWAEEHRTGRRYEVFVTNDDERETEYSIRLVGTNPNSRATS